MQYGSHPLNASAPEADGTWVKRRHELNKMSGWVQAVTKHVSSQVLLHTKGASKMRIVVLIGALAALAVAIPYPQEHEPPDEEGDPESISAPFATPTIPAVLTTSLNIPVTSQILEPGTPTSSRKNPHWEPIPIFTKECKCDIATVRYPCWATDALQRCNYEENFSYGCYMAAAGGCPTPTRACKDLYQPTPRTGRHPCELGQNPPLITSVPELTTLIPVVPTLNISLSWSPSANATLPVSLPVQT